MYIESLTLFCFVIIKNNENSFGFVCMHSNMEMKHNHDPFKMYNTFPQISPHLRRNIFSGYWCDLQLHIKYKVGFKFSNVVITKGVTVPLNKYLIMLISTI